MNWSLEMLQSYFLYEYRITICINCHISHTHSRHTDIPFGVRNHAQIQNQSNQITTNYELFLRITFDFSLILFNHIYVLCLIHQIMNFEFYSSTFFCFVHKHFDQRIKTRSTRNQIRQHIQKLDHEFARWNNFTFSLLS